MRNRRFVSLLVLGSLMLAYNFPALLEVSEKLARQALNRSGGRVEKDAAGQEVFVIPVVDPRPSPLELSWAPGPIAGSMFTPEEMALIKKNKLVLDVKVVKL